MVTRFLTNRCEEVKVVEQLYIELLKEIKTKVKNTKFYILKKINYMRKLNFSKIVSK